MSLAKSLLQLTQSKVVKSIVLSGSEDLMCVNLFCEKVGGPCICRLERALSNWQLTTTVEDLDLSNNSLTQLPPSLMKLAQLRTLNLSQNRFTTLDAESLSTLPHLQHLNVRNNPLDQSVLEHLKRSLPSVVVMVD
jgi:Ran GTPase-activating protein (RanGAP) involved in mRNA processing and transport